MTDLDAVGLKDFSRHFLGCNMHSRDLPREILELQEYLNQLTACVDKYHKMKDGLEREVPPVRSPSTRTSKPQAREVGFSVREEPAPGVRAEVIQVPPAEVVTVITAPEPSSEGELSADDSEIGIYFIDEVDPVHLLNIVQRELSGLCELFPGVSDIVREISSEFEHFKECCKCLKKVAALLPDILKEIQELVKYIKKRRNEPYVWPDDSDYLRKSPEGQTKPFKKDEAEKRKPRKETVGFVTVCTKTPKVVEEAEAGIGEPVREHVRRCSVRITNPAQLFILESEMQSDVQLYEKAETVEKWLDRFPAREMCVVAECSASQMIEFVKPEPIVETAVQLRVGGRIRRGDPSSVLEEHDDDDDEESRQIAETEEKWDDKGFVTLSTLSESVAPSEMDDDDDIPIGLQVKRFLLTARIALGEACLDLQMEGEARGNLETENGVKSEVRDLRSLILEVHKNQIELSKLLLEKGVTNPAMVHLTDPQILREEREGMLMADSSLEDVPVSEVANAATATDVDHLQRMVESLKTKCRVKNRVIVALLKGLRSNVPKQKWEGVLSKAVGESASATDTASGKLRSFIRRNSLPFTESEKATARRVEEWTTTKREILLEEVSSEKETRCSSYEESFESARLSFTDLTDVIDKASKCLRAVRSEYGVPPETPGSDNEEAEKLLRNLERDVGPRDRAVTEDAESSGSTTINLTIKIGEQDARSGYLSALSIVPSGATLKGKKSMTSLSVKEDEESVKEFRSAFEFPTQDEEKESSGRSSSGSFTSLALKLRLPLSFDGETATASTRGILKRSHTPAIEDAPAAVEEPKWCTEKGKSRADGAKGSAIESGSNTSNLYPEMDVHCEQNNTIERLRMRLKYLEGDVKSLKKTIDRMDILTNKIVDDAYESSDNFKDISRRFTFITGRVH